LLRRVLVEAGGTEAIVRRMQRGSDSHSFALLLLAPREPLDWDLVRTRERIGLITPDAWPPLSRQLGCPQEIRAKAAELLTPTGSRPPPGAPRPPAEILAQTAPAATALTACQNPHPDHRADPGAALAALAGPTLGTDVEAWRVALSLLPDFAGTVPELLRTARAVVSGRGPGR
jgi:hypothetical protein